MIQLLCLFCLWRVLAQIHEGLTERQRRGSREQCVLRALNEDVCGETFFCVSVLTGDLRLLLWCIALPSQKQGLHTTCILQPFIRSLLSLSLLAASVLSEFLARHG